MGGNFSLSNTEQEIMEVLWNAPAPYTPRELLLFFNSHGKDWKRQTLNTLLTRLENKSLTKRENHKIYTLYTRTEYKQMQSNEILDNMYNGSIGNFISALTGKNQITGEDEIELYRFIENLQSK